MLDITYNRIADVHTLRKQLGNHRKHREYEALLFARLRSSY